MSLAAVAAVAGASLHQPRLLPQEAGALFAKERQPAPPTKQTGVASVEIQSPRLEEKMEECLHTAQKASD